MRYISLILLTCLLSLGAYAFDTDSLHRDTSVKSAPVVFNKDTIFKIYTAPERISLQERAQLISSRLSAVAGLASFDVKRLVVLQDSGYYRIVYGDTIIIFLDEKDALANGKQLAELATGYHQLIKDKVLAYRAFETPTSIMVSVAEALGVVLMLVLLIVVMHRLYRWVLQKYIRRRQFRPLVINKYELIGSRQYRAFLIRLISFARWVCIALIVYLSLPLVFSLFPWTHGVATKLIGFVVRPFVSIVRGIINYFPNLITILVIYLVTRYFVKLVKYFATEISKGRLNVPGFYADWALPTFKIVKSLLYIFMFIVIFPYMPGSDSKVFQGVSVFLGILFSIGSSSAVSNIVAGVVITYMRPFKVGDRVKIGDVMGDVLEKNLLVTRIRTIKNEEITIPNANILNGGTINYSSLAKSNGLILHTTATIGYDTPWKQVHGLLIKAAQLTDGILQEPAPFVLQTSLDDYYVSYQLNAYTELPHQMVSLYSALHQNIQDVFNEAGVEIMSPAYHSLRDGNTVTIPPDKRPEGYEPGSFRMKEG